MKILSFDVGAIHLAYCLLEIDPDKIPHFSIKEWNVVNLCDYETEQKTCCECPNAIKYSHPVSNLGYCVKHSRAIKNIVVAPKLAYKIKKLNKLLLVSDIWMPLLKSLKSQEEHVLEYIKEKAFMKLRNMTFKDLTKEYLGTFKKDELLFQAQSIIQRFTWRSKERKTIDQVTAIQMGKHLKMYMDALKKDQEWDKIIDKVVIENQLGNLAVKMMRIQGMITQYFIDNGIEDIEYIPATKKLSGEFVNDLSTNYEIDVVETATYNDRKKSSVMIVGQLVKQSEWEEYFNHHKKKDDLADCLLQGLCVS
jgi:hypothetical protein